MPDSNSLKENLSLVQQEVLGFFPQPPPILSFPLFPPSWSSYSYIRVTLTKQQENRHWFHLGKPQAFWHKGCCIPVDPGIMWPTPSRDVASCVGEATRQNTSPENRINQDHHLLLHFHMSLEMREFLSIIPLPHTHISQNLYLTD